MNNLKDGKLTTEEVIMKCGLSLNVKKVFGLCSGGKDSMSACSIAHKIRPLDGIILVDTTIVAKNKEDKPSYIAAKNFAKKLGIPFICIKPLENLKVGFEYVKCIKDYGEGKVYENYCKKYGFPHANLHNQVFRYLKKKAMVGFVKSLTSKNEKVAFISGVRQKESKRRMKNAQLIGIDEDTNKLVWIAPIYYWSTAKAFGYVKENGYKLSDSYKTLHLSGDCLCGAYADRKETHLIKVFYPDTAKQIAYIESIAQKDHKGILHWGNGDSMTGTLKQKSLSEHYGCSECEIRYNENE